MKKDAVSAVSLKVLETVRKYDMFREGAQVVVGFSGGPDSLCLFDVLCGMAEPLGLTLIPVHVNHGLRGEASDGDQKFCEEFCGERGIILRTVSIDCERDAAEMGVSTETAGRIRRYEAFAEAAAEALASSGKETVIAVAHNADDRVETVLQHLLRGSGTAGLSSIPYVRMMGEFKVVRPVLGVTRGEIEEYCAARGLEPCRDATNDEPVYGRNRIRLGLIPELEKYSPGVKDALLRLADSASEDEETLRGLADEAFGEMASACGSGEIRIKGDEFRGLQPAVAKRVLRKALAEIGLTEDVTSAHYEAMMYLAGVSGPSGRTDLPGGYGFEMEYGDLILKAPAAGTSGASMPGGAEGMPRMDISAVTREEYEELKALPKEAGTVRIFFDAEGFAEGETPELRTRRPGDYIRLKGGTRKLQDLLVDMKVPRRKRDSLPLIAAGSEVLFAGAEKPRYSAARSVTETTKKVLYIELKY